MYATHTHTLNPLPLVLLAEFAHLQFTFSATHNTFPSFLSLPPSLSLSLSLFLPLSASLGKGDLFVVCGLAAWLQFASGPSQALLGCVPFIHVLTQTSIAAGPGIHTHIHTQTPHHTYTHTPHTHTPHTHLTDSFSHTRTHRTHTHTHTAELQCGQRKRAATSDLYLVCILCLLSLSLLCYHLCMHT